MKSSDSVFNAMSDKQWDQFNDEQGWSSKLTRALKKELATQEAEGALRQQTEMFWLLQLQFLSIDKTSESAYNTLSGIYFSPMYNNNKFTRKIRQILFESHWRGWTDGEFACLCTHFALQLAGVEE